MLRYFYIFLLWYKQLKLFTLHVHKCTHSYMIKIVPKSSDSWVRPLVLPRSALPNVWVVNPSTASHDLGLPTCPCAALATTRATTYWGLSQTSGLLNRVLKASEWPSETSISHFQFAEALFAYENHKWLTEASEGCSGACRVGCQVGKHIQPHQGHRDPLQRTRHFKVWESLI